MTFQLKSRQRYTCLKHICISLYSNIIHIETCRYAGYMLYVDRIIISLHSHTYILAPYFRCKLSGFQTISRKYDSEFLHNSRLLYSHLCCIATVLWTMKSPAAVISVYHHAHWTLSRVHLDLSLFVRAASVNGCSGWSQKRLRKNMSLCCTAYLTKLPRESHADLDLHLIYTVPLWTKCILWSRHNSILL